MHRQVDDGAAAGAVGTAVGPRQPSKARRRTTDCSQPADTADDAQLLTTSS